MGRCGIPSANAIHHCIAKLHRTELRTIFDPKYKKIMGTSWKHIIFISENLKFCFVGRCVRLAVSSFLCLYLLSFHELCFFHLNVRKLKMIWNMLNSKFNIFEFCCFWYFFTQNVNLKNGIFGIYLQQSAKCQMTAQTWRKYHVFAKICHLECILSSKRRFFSSDSFCVFSV